VPLLEVSVTDGQYGPVLALSGEADLTTLGQLNSALDEQIWAGVRLLTVDLSRLRYADSASIAALVQAARTLRGQGGDLELLRPQPSVTRILSLTGVDQALVIRGEGEAVTPPDGMPQLQRPGC
jgi:anti-sigma B factor antagonist